MKRAVVIGGGIAGCSTAYALARRGMQVTLLERHASLGFEASGNQIAMLYPRLSGLDHLSEFALTAYLQSLNLFKSLDLNIHEFNQCGMLQLGFNPRELARIQKVAAYYQEKNLLHYATCEQASQLAGVVLQHDALYFPQAGWIKPHAILRRLIEHHNISTKTLIKVNKILKYNDIFEIHDMDHKVIEAEIVVICNSNEAKNFDQSAHCYTQAIRGQISLLNTTDLSKHLQMVVCSDGYFSPAIDNIHSLGATYSAENMDLKINSEDHLSNLHTLKTISEPLYQNLMPSKIEKLHGRVGLRCTTPDYFPLLGQLLNTKALQNYPPRPSAQTHALPWVSGLYINTAHGSKGFTSAPLCADLLAALICKEPLPTSEKLTGLLNPNRLILRDMGLKRLAKSIAISS